MAGKAGDHLGTAGVVGVEGPLRRSERGLPGEECASAGSITPFFPPPHFQGDSGRGEGAQGRGQRQYPLQEMPCEPRWKELGVLRDKMAGDGAVQVPKGTLFMAADTRAESAGLSCCSPDPA